jgi:AcrR family transcriptional regulator
MPSRNDWLVGRDRRSEATERIYAAAVDLIARQGYDALTIEALAATVHCSPATIYRHAGGKTAIRDAVVAIHAARILGTVRAAIEGLHGVDRVVTATLVALDSLRSDPLAKLMRPMHPSVAGEWVTSSPVVTELASEMLGGDEPDPVAAQWLIRVFLALWSWPVADRDAERALVTGFFAASFVESAV